MEKAAYVEAARKQAVMAKTGRLPGPGYLFWFVLLVIALLSPTGRAQIIASDSHALSPEPAVSAILKLFDTYEVVGITVRDGRQ